MHPTARETCALLNEHLKRRSILACCVAWLTVVRIPTFIRRCNVFVQVCNMRCTIYVHQVLNQSRD